jgi:heme A synthase
VLLGRGWRLALNVAAWTVAIPILGIIGSVLGKTMFRSGEAEVVMAHAIEVVLVLWAALIYWRCVPSTPSMLRRAIYLALFVATMLVVGYFALGAAVMVVVLLFGL